MTADETNRSRVAIQSRRPGVLKLQGRQWLTIIVAQFPMHWSDGHTLWLQEDAVAGTPSGNYAAESFDHSLRLWLLDWLEVIQLLRAVVQYTLGAARARTGLHTVPP